MRILIVSLLLSALSPLKTFAQAEARRLNRDRFSIHAQTTVINQFKPAFAAPYAGPNSLSTAKESQTSITSTFFFGTGLWKGASVHINPEIAGGSGLSQVLGIAAATNGETFRIGNPAPKIYIARLFFRQVIALSSENSMQESDFNVIGGPQPDKYLSFTVGKIGVADYFDNNAYSHDPRTQFMSWALMDNGAWDYPANTRGYAPSAVVAYVSPRHELRYGFSLVPLVANGSQMNWDIANAGSHTLEYTHNHTVGNRKGALRLLGFFTSTNMGSYRESLARQPEQPVIEDSRRYGHTKYGVGFNADQQLTNDLGGFFRASWNDGHNETWVFTEIDRSVSGGLVLSGTRWKRGGRQPRPGLCSLGYLQAPPRLPGGGRPGLHAWRRSPQLRLGTPDRGLLPSGSLARPPVPERCLPTHYQSRLQSRSPRPGECVFRCGCTRGFDRAGKKAIFELNLKVQLDD